MSSSTCYISVIQAHICIQAICYDTKLHFSKAFDLISYKILLNRLVIFGFPSIVMKSVASFLIERSRPVPLCNTASDWNHIHGGVSQDTKLGPVPFVLMINDLQTKWNSNKYVDHTCFLYIGSASQAPNLQEAADAAYLWTIQNNMKINKSNMCIPMPRETNIIL